MIRSKHTKHPFQLVFSTPTNINSHWKYTAFDQKHQSSQNLMYLGWRKHSQSSMAKRTRYPTFIVQNLPKDNKCLFPGWNSKQIFLKCCFLQLLLWKPIFDVVKPTVHPTGVLFYFSLNIFSNHRNCCYAFWICYLPLSSTKYCAHSASVPVRENSSRTADAQMPPTAKPEVLPSEKKKKIKEMNHFSSRESTSTIHLFLIVSLFTYKVKQQ